MRVLVLFGLLLSVLLLPADGSTGYAFGAGKASKYWERGEWVTPTHPNLGTNPLSISQFEPPFEQHERWIRAVYTGRSNGNFEVFASIPPTEFGSYTIINLSNYLFATDSHPRLSSNGETVVFVSARTGELDIFRVGITGGPVTQLTNASGSDTQPAWSPDGSTIAFASFRDNNWNIYRMDANGGNQIALTSGLEIDVMPSWSPDGSQIAWVQASGTSGSIWVMNADGSNKRVLYSDVAYLQHPIWSPDGTKIAFDGDFTGDGFNEAAVINADGTGLQTFSAQPIVNGVVPEFQMLDWSPEGERLVLTHYGYELVNGQYLATFASVRRLNIATQQLIGISFSTGAVQADLHSMDQQPPISTITNLPPYSRRTFIPVAWSGVDRGISGNIRFDVQYRLGSGAWVDWYQRTTEVRAVYQGTSGQQVSFRVRARDEAGNVEDWKAVEPTTRMYSNLLNGEVYDNRGIGLPEVTIGVNPSAFGDATSTQDGSYQHYFGAATSHTLTFANTAYGSLPATILATAGDRSAYAVLAPQDNLIEQGTFEGANALSAWSTAGTIPVQLKNIPLTGVQSVQIGQPTSGCDPICLTSQEVITTSAKVAPAFISPHEIVVDADGVVHSIWSYFDNITLQSRTVYQYRSPNGVWSTPELLEAAINRELVLDQAGTLHLLSTRADDLQVRYWQRQRNGVWSAPVNLNVRGYVEALVIDQAGTLSTIVNCQNDCTGEIGNRHVLLSRPANGSWSQAVTVPSGAQPMVGPANTLYLAWVDAQRNLVIAPSNAQGELGAAIIANAGISELYSPFFQVVASDDGTFQAVWRDSIARNVWQRVTFAGAILETQIFSVVSSLRVYRAPGNIHWMIQEGETGTLPKLLKRVQGEWALMAELTPASYYQLGFSQNGQIHLVGVESSADNLNDELRYRTEPTNTTAGVGSVSQQLTIPADLYKPTLSWNYRLEQLQPGGSQFVVRINNGSATTVYTATQPGDWQHAWVDLQPWLGQQVTVTFELQQQANASVALAQIDDVSLGSWRTPILTEVVFVGLNQPGGLLTLTGENFIDTPTVQIGTQTLSGVVRVNDTTLQVPLPSNLAPGRYTVRVINAGGQQALLANILFGNEIFLPSITR